MESVLHNVAETISELA